MRASFFALAALCVASAQAAFVAVPKNHVAAHHRDIRKTHDAPIKFKRGGSPKTSRCAAKTSSIISASSRSTVSVESTRSVASTSSKHHTSTTTAKKAEPTDGGDSGSGGNFPFAGKTFTGDATVYEIGLDSCGHVDHEPDMIAAVAIARSQDYPGFTGNPNTNPICGKKVQACYHGDCIVVSIMDSCSKCGYDDLDFSHAAFKHWTPEITRLHGMTWHFLE